MMSIGIVIVLQIVIAGIVFSILWRLLDRELVAAAIEKLMSVKTSAEVKVVNVYHGNVLPVRIEEKLKILVKNKFTNSDVFFEQLKSLKGGLIIKVADEVLDFSISSRLENFWS
jgi:F0F1-type ATP synthase delta subunit